MEDCFAHWNGMPWNGMPWNGMPWNGISKACIYQYKPYEIAASNPSLRAAVRSVTLPDFHQSGHRCCKYPLQRAGKKERLDWQSRKGCLHRFRGWQAAGEQVF